MNTSELNDINDINQLFYSELNNQLTKCNENSDNSTKELCLLTNSELTTNYITLPCKHKFNYEPLYKEVINQKKYNLYNTYPLKINQIRCPYCRTTLDRLLPYIPGEGIKRYHGINSPSKYEMTHMKCCWIFKSGMKKGQQCKKNGYKTCHGNYCSTHMKVKNKQENIVNIVLTNDMLLYSKNHTIKMIKDVLKQNNKMISGNKKHLVKRIFDNNLQ